MIPGLPPPFLHTASDQKLDGGKAWEQISKPFTYVCGNNCSSRFPKRVWMGAVTSHSLTFHDFPSPLTSLLLQFSFFPSPSHLSSLLLTPSSFPREEGGRGYDLGLLWCAVPTGGGAEGRKADFVVREEPCRGTHWVCGQGTEGCYFRVSRLFEEKERKGWGREGERGRRWEGRKERKEGGKRRVGKERVRGGGRRNKRREEKRNREAEGRSDEALKRMLCLAVLQPFSFHVMVVFSSHQLCEVLTTTESGLPETQTNHRNWYWWSGNQLASFPDLPRFCLPFSFVLREQKRNEEGGVWEHG